MEWKLNLFGFVCKVKRGGGGLVCNIRKGGVSRGLAWVELGGGVCTK